MDRDEDDFTEDEDTQDDLTEDTEEDDTPKEAERLSLLRSFYAKADPASVTELSEELQPAFDRAVAKYRKEKEADSDDLYYGSHVIWPVQYVIAHTFMKTNGTTSLLAKTGFGKSLTAIATSLLADICLILVPNAVMPTWIGFLEQYGLHDVRSPKESTVLVYSVAYSKAHRIFFDSPGSQQALAKRKQIIVLGAHIHLAEIMQDIFKKSLVKGRDFTIIVDEAHERIPGFEAWIQRRVGIDITRELLMSGSELTPQIIKMNGYGTIDHTILVTGSNEMPNDTWDIRLMSSPSYRTDSQEWADEVKAIARDSNRLVIFSEIDAKKMLIAKKIFGRKNVYQFTTQKGTIEKFNADPNAVLFVSRTKTTGFNVNADAMIIFNPGDATTEKLIQTTKRIMRPDNPYREVTIYLLCGIPKDYYRGMYAKAFSLLSWPFGREKIVNTSMIYKAIASIRMLGVDHEIVNAVDLCVFFCDYAELQHTGRMVRPLEEILAWWNANKLPDTVLTEQIISNLVILPD